MENLKLWDSCKAVPVSYQKTITGGRLNGMTDIKPQWRYQKMTELFGVVGFGWKFEIAKEHIVDFGNDLNEKMINITVHLFVKINDKWSDPIIGYGGSMLVTKEKLGLHNSDEAYKMALTDALSVAMKMLGVGAEIYLGENSATKYTKPFENTQKLSNPMPIQSSDSGYTDSELYKLCAKVGEPDKVLIDFSTFEKDGKKFWFNFAKYHGNPAKYASWAANVEVKIHKHLKEIGG